MFSVSVPVFCFCFFVLLIATPYDIMLQSRESSQNRYDNISVYNDTLHSYSTGLLPLECKPTNSTSDLSCKSRRERTSYIFLRAWCYHWFIIASRLKVLSERSDHYSSIVCLQFMIVGKVYTILGYFYDLLLLPRLLFK